MSEAAPVATDPKVTWDDDCEQIVIEHPVDGGSAHVHHKRLAIIKKSADSITLEPMFKSPVDAQAFGHEKQWTYVRTKDTDIKGRAIFRQGVA